MKPKIPQRIYEAVSEENFIKLLKNTKKVKHFLCYILAYGSGLRVSEILALQPEDLNLKENKIFVRQGKGMKDRVTIAPKWLKQKHLPMFPIKLKRRAVTSAFHSASRRAGFNSILYTDNGGKVRMKYHFHCLRHSFGTRAIEKKVPLNQIQLLMGHENISTTSRYLRANPTDAIQSFLDGGV